MKNNTSSLTEGASNPVTRMVRSWNRFWFNPADPTALGLIRIFCGLLTLYVHLAYTVDLQELMGPNAWLDLTTANKFRNDVPFTARTTDWDERNPTPNDLNEEEKKYQEEWFGANPRRVTAKGTPVWSIWYHVTEPTQMAVAHGIILFIMFLFTIGFCTRITSVLAWMGAMCYIHRGQSSLFGMDTMMNILLIYLMIGPSGAALSVDRLIQRYWQTWKALWSHRPAPDFSVPVPLVSANLALRLIQINLCLIYLSSGLSKLEGRAWWQGTAVWGTMANTEFSPMHIPLFRNFLILLSEHRWVWEIFMTGGSVFTLATEIGFIFLIWSSRLRWTYLTMAVILHTGIALFMGLNTFSLFMMVMLLSFVPIATIRWVLQRIGHGKRQLRLEYNGRSLRQVRSVALVHAFDTWDQVELINQSSGGRTLGGGEITVSPQKVHGVGTLRPEADGAQNPFLRLIENTGEIRTGYPLFERVVRSLRLLWPVAAITWIPGVAKLGNARFPGATQALSSEGRVENGKPHSRGEKVARK
ncbi:MAG TPA: hypothetical protein VGY77_00930 [Gemmataceae bacterium]|nr:hypothetical protein [Gemmataceae bacterium]